MTMCYMYSQRPVLYTTQLNSINNQSKAKDDYAFFNTQYASRKYTKLVYYYYINILNLE